MQGLFDTHVHLNDQSLIQDIDGVIARAEAEGVARMLCVGWDIDSSRRAVEIASRYRNIWASVGVHPHDAKSLDADSMAEIKDLAGKPKVVALGEIGLDFYRDLSPRPVQESAFRKQLAIAKELDLPVIIHDRDAGADIMRIILDEGPPAAGGVMHCFSEDADYALQAVELGFYIGIAGPVTFNKSDALREVVRKVPEDRLLIETDAPYLTPEPFRGRKPNEPSFVRFVAEKIAEVRKTDAETIAKITDANAERLFKRLRNKV
ncbi:MAG TPA: TatD family hydrolase [Armatimonadota bacterium]|nr:TatD family hydrolase [Armatimonadota bacterium]